MKTIVVGFMQGFKRNEDTFYCNAADAVSPVAKKFTSNVFVFEMQFPCECEIIAYTSFSFQGLSVIQVH